MEGVPRIPMLSFPMRRSADTPHFKSRLKSFISNHYTEDPESYGNEIHELESLRASAVHVSKDYSGCSTLKKYFCQLNFLKSRFPMNEGGTCAISFSWYDVFSDTVHGWSDVDFEMSCVLYNIGALHSELGALDNRQTADGMKTSCTHFQCAAWAFSHLRHNYQKFFTPDVSPDMLNILMNVCLAQAQECILEKSLIDNRKSTITAKVALQIVEYYSTALRIIDGMLKDSAQYSDKLIKAVKKWRKLVELKVHYYGCIAYLYRGMQAEDQGKWGERVTMYKAGTEKLNECIKLAKNMEKTDAVHDTLHFTLDVLGGKVAIAEKENEFIYHEKVPDLEAVMSDVKAVSLVKGIPFKFDDIQIAGPDIFGRLVPMEAHEASSLYSEEKAKILRTYSRKIEERNEALDKFIVPLQLDQLELHDSDKLPQELIDCCAALSVNQDAVKRLSELMAKLSSLFHDVEANLEEIQDHLADQEKKENEYQEIVGKRPPNNIINEISRELQKYQSAQAVAAESNKTLHEAMVVHVANLTILMKPLDEVVKHIPKYDELEKNDEALERMKKLAGKVSEMRKQREMLEGQLRDSILNDDITKSLVVKKDEDLDSVFKEELQKHDKITQVLDQNLLAQENIIRALTEANAEYAETRRATVELKKKRDKVIHSFINSYEAYDELISKCNKGIEFYVKLNANVEKLLQRVKSVCKVQNEERETNMERIIRKTQITNAPQVPTSVGYGNVPGYPSGYTPAPAVPSSYSPQGTTVPTPNMPMARTTGGHLKLKDYLAMKKEGQTAAELAATMNMRSSTPPGASFDPTAGQLTHSKVSDIGPQADAPYNPAYNRDAFGMGVRPAPVGSEDAGKDLACSYSYSPQQMNPQSYNNYSMVSNNPASNYYPPNAAAVPTNNFVGSQQGYGQSSQPASSSTYHEPQGPSGGTRYQQQYPSVNPVAPTPVNQFPTPPVASAPPPTHNVNINQQPTPSNYVNQQQYAPAVPHGVPYIPNQPGYNPVSTMNTSTYATPVYSSGQYPSGIGKPSDEVNTSAAYSSAYGVPLSYAGARFQNSNVVQPPSQQQYPPAAPTPPVMPPGNTDQNINQSNATASFYSPVYHPTANTSTHATYSTGTTTTAAAAGPGSQSLGTENTPPASSQLPPSVSSDINSSYSQTSFLAQYVRQNQGYLSSKSPQPNSSFPSSVNYGTDGSPTYPQQQQVAYSQQSQPPTATYPDYGTSQYSNPEGVKAYGQHQQPHNIPPTGVARLPQPTDVAQVQQPQGSYPAAAPLQQQQSNYNAPVQQYQQQQYVGGQQLSNATGTYYNAAGVISQHPVQEVPAYQQPAYQQPQNTGSSQPTPVAPTVPAQSRTKPFTNSNLDLLSDIDFNALPAVEPLAPVILPAAANSSPVHAATVSDSTTNNEEMHVASPASSLASLPTTTMPSYSSSTSSVQIPSLPISTSSVSNRKGSATHVTTVDPFQDPLVLEKFTFEIEKFENTVEGLAKKSLNGPTLRLDLKWKELLDIQNATSVKRSISVARCYPMKNRFPDIMPYDQTRVPIPNTKDDYINASFINDLSPAAYPMIATQAPLPATMADFWHMIWQHYIELVICLCGDTDLKELIYWPNEKRIPLEYGGLQIVLQTKNIKNHYIERILSISHRDLKQSRVVVHLQFTGWPGHTFPVSPGPFVGFVKEVANYYHQQRNLNHPVVVHCLSGVGKSGVFCVIASAIQEIDQGHGMPDLLQIAGTASEQRKGIMNDKEYLRFAFHSLLYYGQDILMKRGILSAKSRFDEKPKKSHIRHPSQDFLQDISLSKLIDKVNNTDNTSNATTVTSTNESSPSASVQNLSKGGSVTVSPVHKLSNSLKRSSSPFESSSKPKLTYSDVPDSLTNIDPATFRLNTDSSDELVNAKKQAFENNKGALFERTANNTADPLSSLDPLWTIKK